MDHAALEARFTTLIDLFQDSPNVQATYIDLRRVYEDLITVLAIISEKRIGFQMPPKENNVQLCQET